jgi:EmrB/QacA subfamily drug resistance transporter
MTPPSESPALASDRADRLPVLALGAMGLAVIVIANDFTAFGVALPTIQKDLHSTLSTVQWVVNAYALVFGVVIVTGGRLADMFGRRRLFVIGAVIFAGFSLLGGFAQGDIWLIAARALMGIGGALMWPSILGMTYELLPASKAGLAGGLILGAAGFGNAIGPLLGGLLTDALSWRWIFFLNLPIAGLGVLATLVSIKPDTPKSDRGRLDYAGVAFLTLGLFSLLLALDESSTWGWADARVLALLVAAVLLVALFVRTERRAGSAALVPGEVMGDRNFAAACCSVLLMSAVFFTVLLYLPQFMTKVLGFSALKSGVGLLPMMATFAVVSFVAGSLYQRLGPKLTVSVGAAFLTAGMFLLSLIDPGDQYSALLLGMFVLGAGVGLFYSSVTTAGVTALDPSHASLAGGIVYMCQVGGGSIGLGISTVVVTAAGSTTNQLVDGIGHAFLLDGVLALLATVVAVLFVGGAVSPHPLHVYRRHLHRAHP